MKVFLTDFYDGSTTDKIRGITTTLSIPYNNMVQKDKGFCVNFKKDNNSFFTYPLVYTPFNTPVSSDTYSFHIFYQKLSNYWSGSNRLFIHGIEGQSNNILLIDNGATIYLTLRNDDNTAYIFNSVIINTSSKIGAWHLVSFSINKIEKSITPFFDGVAYPKKFLSGILNTNFILNKVLNIGGQTGSVPGLQGDLQYFEISTDPLSYDSHKNLYLNLINRKPINKPIYFQPNLNTLKPNELREEGLIAAYNMNSVNGKLINIAWDNPANGFNARGYDLTCLKTQTTTDGLVFKSGSLCSLSVQKNLGKTHTLYIESKVSNSMGELYWMFGSGGSGGFGWPNGAGFFYRTLGVVTPAISSSSYLIKNNQIVFIAQRNQSNIKIWVNGLLVLEHTLSLNEDFLWDNVVRGNNGGGSSINKILVYNTIKDVKTLYNQFASKIVLKEDFFQYPVGATKFGNWINTSTANTVKELTQKISNTLTIGTRYIGGSTNSDSLLLPSSTAYGTWEYDFLTPVSNLETGLAFIKNNFYRPTSHNLNQSYILYFLGSKTTYLYRGGSYPLLNLNLTWSNNTWYHVKITRSNANLFSVWIDGVFRGSVTDANITSSKCIHSHSIAGITNLTIKQGVEV